VPGKSRRSAGILTSEFWLLASVVEDRLLTLHREGVYYWPRSLRRPGPYNCSVVT
jgi:hypothetical protein